MTVDHAVQVALANIRDANSDVTVADRVHLLRHIEALRKSRAEIIEECARVCVHSAARLAGSPATASGYTALVLVADEIRRLANKEGA
ncbi:hypothetical protein BGLT_05227 [Caballeronia glathei]|uniref:Uncharacterized protein n=1 Tax=Caballeronia glathei TaxID=60547 RepID=A0A069PA96_9BURK|nr:hypothetical protein [Caballeronia glathei]KDR37575.1 hypothetical protein BG61_13605 [Caballeronia glathei]CDY76154.1 hypothetical protein BGLT_05227 [Caballeronia glathei]